MSRLIAQILLSILMFPLAGLVYLLVFVVFMQANRGRYSPNRDDVGFLMTGLLTWGFIAAYWLALWRKSIQWTGRRSTQTALSFAGAALAAGLLGVVAGAVLEEASFGIFVATIAAPVLWLVGTILAWRETDAERAERLSAQGIAQLVCPTCGYNMSGLKAARCPECGSEFTLDALLAGQPALRQAEVER